MALHPLDTYELSWTPDIADVPGPRYLALADRLERDVETGVLVPGTRLPPQRELARYLGVNLSTVSRAFKLCEQRGLLCAAVGNGTYVAPGAGTDALFLCADDGVDDVDLAKGCSREVVDLGATVPLEDGNDEVKRYIERLLRRPDALGLLSYGAPEGTLRQRRAGAAWLRRTGFSDADPSCVALAAGGQNAIVAALGALFAPGDRVGCDPLTYPGVRTAAKLLGIHLVPVQGDENGMTEEGIRYAARTDNVKGLYVIPDFHNPTTRTMPPATRAMVARVAAEEGLAVVEDGINCLLREKPLAPVASYDPERVVLLSSLSKTVSPGLRCAFVHAPRRCVDKLVGTLYAMNIALSPLVATTAAGLIEEGVADGIVARRRAAIAERNAVVDEELAGWRVDGAPTCPFRWLRLPAHFSGKSFEVCAEAAGVRVFGSERFAVGGPGVEPAVRLSITTPASVDELRTGVRALAGLLRR